MAGGEEQPSLLPAASRGSTQMSIEFRDNRLNLDVQSGTRPGGEPKEYSRQTDRQTSMHHTRADCL